MGSKSDLPKLQAGIDALKDLGIPHEVRVISAHRTPERAAEFAQGAADRGLKVIIAAAGGAAHLAGTLAAHTNLPIIGVPVNATALAGLDALLATVQMPAGIPVATVAIDGAQNAALLAAQILALSDPALGDRLRDQRQAMARKVEAADASVAGPAAEQG
ncbi:MAG: 5-(carboxyamino)imidazole ribonucleotide mutase [Deltaproteobacteria bacterium]|nr:5-(carboxyamino)imidazole ribonucleotide mutase [Deltaproteobacteria bacterium]